MMETDDAHAAQQATAAWARDFVAQMNLCPFASAPLRQGRVRVVASLAAEIEAALEDLGVEAHRLARAEPAALATTLVAYPNAPDDFEGFLAWIDWAETLLDHLGLADTLRLAHFHPAYRFAPTGDAAEDASAATDAYAGRAPYPTLHLLRASDLDEVAALPMTASVPQRNSETLARVGAADLEERLRSFRP